jgi:hypothetical protein
LTIVILGNLVQRMNNVEPESHDHDDRGAANFGFGEESAGPAEDSEKQDLCSIPGFTAAARVVSP